MDTQRVAAAARRLEAAAAIASSVASIQGALWAVRSTAATSAIRGVSGPTLLASIMSPPALFGVDDAGTGIVQGVLGGQAQREPGLRPGGRQVVERDGRADSGTPVVWHGLSAFGAGRIGVAVDVGAASVQGDGFGTYEVGEPEPARRCCPGLRRGGRLKQDLGRGPILSAARPAAGARVYAYFRSKEALYRHVAVRELSVLAEATHMDPTDLPGYAGRVHDHLARHPERHRLTLWGRLELPAGETPPDDPFQRSVRHKVEQLRKAQEAGHLDLAWIPEDILMFVSQIATSWAAEADLAPVGEERDAFMAARRIAIVTAVQRLFPATARDAAPAGGGR